MAEKFAWKNFDDYVIDPLCEERRQCVCVCPCLCTRVSPCRKIGHGLDFWRRFQEIVKIRSFFEEQLDNLQVFFSFVCVIVQVCLCVFVCAILPEGSG